MIKLTGFIKRRQGMSKENFRHHYESIHRVIGEKYLKGHATRYLRRYLSAAADPLTGQAVEAEYDVLLEIWYPSQQAMETATARMSEPGPAKEIQDDIVKFFDLPSMRYYFLDDCESKLD